MASDRYGIMDKLKRLQEGEDLDELLAEMDEEMPARGRRADDSRDQLYKNRSFRKTDSQ